MLRWSVVTVAGIQRAPVPGDALVGPQRQSENCGVAGSLGQQRWKPFVTELYKGRRDCPGGSELPMAGWVQARAG